MVIRHAARVPLHQGCLIPDNWNWTRLTNLVYLHLGHISVQRAILRVREFRSKAKDSVEAFVEEAVVRRELADNFCFYNPDHYDSIKGTNAWAQKTLQDHAQDKREYLYTREQLENGDTHDDLWNSAQVGISYAE